MKIIVVFGTRPEIIKLVRENTERTEILRNLAREHGSSLHMVTNYNRLENITDRVLRLEDGMIASNG